MVYWLTTQNSADKEKVCWNWMPGIKRSKLYDFYSVIVSAGI